jgi:hypothetical protein
MRRGLSPNRIRGALARATDAELTTLQSMVRESLLRTSRTANAIEAEIDRRHWPGQILAAA